VSCLGNILTKSFDLFQDRLRCSGPDKGPTAGIVLLDEMLDPGGEFLDTFERSPADGSLGNEVEPDFDLVEPGGRCRGEVHVVSGPRWLPEERAPDRRPATVVSEYPIRMPGCRVSGCFVFPPWSSRFLVLVEATFAPCGGESLPLPEEGKERR